MTSVFKDIDIAWDGKEYVIEGRSRFEIICRVEDQITITEIATMALDPSRLKASAIARGFAAILRFLGVTEVKDGKTIPISSEAVFVRMFGDETGTDSPLMAAQVLLALVQPDAAPAIPAKPRSKRKATNADG